jgi:hypothetical protein
MRMARSALAAAFVLAMSTALVGCSSSDRKAATLTSDPDVVVVDFFHDATRTGACAGTLLATNVVLTSARCAAGSNAARVHAPNAATGAADSDVSRVWTYDYDGADHSQQHDVVVLTLRTPITALYFAAVDTSPCAGCSAVTYARVQSGIVKERPASIDAAAPSGRPFSLRYTSTAASATASATAGAAVRNTHGALIGVYMGAGAKSGQGYVARIDTPGMIRFLHDVVDASGGALQTTGPLNASNAVSVLNTGSGSGGSGSGANGASGGSGSGSGSGASTGDGPDPAADGSNKGGAPEEDVQQDGADTSADDKTSTGAAKPYDDSQSDGKTPPDGYERDQHDNFWTSHDKDDDAFDISEAYARLHPDAALVGVHGHPGAMMDTPDKAAIDAITDGRNGPLIVSSCYAGQHTDDGPSPAQKMVDDAGFPRDRTYTCGGQITPVGGGMLCDGNWSDGNDQPLTDSARAPYGLQNCVVNSRDSSGSWSSATCDGKAADLSYDD